jgi:hypothetical protein
MDAACRRLGQREVVRRCEALLVGGDASPDFVIVLGGAPAIRLLGDGLPADQRYWLRVWSARGLLWAGPPQHLATLRRALGDGHWRVREMACKVVAWHRLGDLFDDVTRLESDGNSRVRAAASRAVRSIVEADG